MGLKCSLSSSVPNFPWRGKNSLRLWDCFWYILNSLPKVFPCSNYWVNRRIIHIGWPLLWVKTTSNTTYKTVFLLLDVGLHIILFETKHNLLFRLCQMFITSGMLWVTCNFILTTIFHLIVLAEQFVMYNSFYKEMNTWTELLHEWLHTL